ncbi:hypothetical protein LSH36_733g01028 [Paralvinella palmiformis]|uniref:Uncharacterized protein n=1 Tax=Paralvinella palmiformis TaxID=53620 RepID=A0AAD9J172_9ANNE|nr:hypothetical protein LSH36_733g01028 [Paralvinella palmiformis]
MVGLVETKQDVLKLMNRLEKAGKRPAIKEAMKIRYQKIVLSKKHFRLKGILFDLIGTLQEHLPEHQPEADQGSDTGVQVVSTSLSLDPESDNQNPKEEDTSDEDVDQSRDHPETSDRLFQFNAQGQWVAVYFNEKVYIGQVIEVENPQLARVQYMLQSTTRKDYFKWPSGDDVADTEAYFVFEWDFEVMSVNRYWMMAAVEEIHQRYNAIKRRSPE